MFTGRYSLETGVVINNVGIVFSKSLPGVFPFKTIVVFIWIVVIILIIIVIIVIVRWLILIYVITILINIPVVNDWSQSFNNRHISL